MSKNHQTVKSKVREYSLFVSFLMVEKNEELKHQNQRQQIKKKKIATNNKVFVCKLRKDFCSLPSVGQHAINLVYFCSVKVSST